MSGHVHDAEVVEETALAKMQTFDFEGSAIQVAVSEQGVEVVVGSVCDALGLATQRQTRKLQSRSWAGVALRAIPTASGVQRVNVIPLRSLPMWMATVNEHRVGERLRERVVGFQLRMHDVLADHFVGPRLSQVAERRPSAAVIGKLGTVRRELLGLCRRAAERCGWTIQKVQGKAKVAFESLAFWRIPLDRIEEVRAWLRDLVVNGPAALSPNPSVIYALPSEGPQASFAHPWFEAGRL